MAIPLSVGVQVPPKRPLDLMPARARSAAAPSYTANEAAESPTLIRTAKGGASSQLSPCPLGLRALAGADRVSRAAGSGLLVPMRDRSGRSAIALAVNWAGLAEQWAPGPGASPACFEAFWASGLAANWESFAAAPPRALGSQARLGLAAGLACSGSCVRERRSLRPRQRISSRVSQEDRGSGCVPSATAATAPIGRPVHLRRRTGPAHMAAAE